MTENRISTLQQESDEADAHLDLMFNRLEWFWLFVGVVAVGVAGYFAWINYHMFLDRIKSKETAQLSIEFILLAKGLILFSVPSAVATYSFKLSKAYIHERLKRAERKHAINFGKLFSEKYGDPEHIKKKVAADDIIKAFQWNISNDTAFSRSGSGELDMKSLLLT